MQKKTLAGLLALSLPLTIFATDALAANRDVHEIDTQKTYVYKQFINNESQFMGLIDKLEDNPSNYLFEMNGYGYNYAALYEKYRATNNLESALEQTPKEQLPGEVEGELKVESVSAINARQILVKFSNTVNLDASKAAATGNHGALNLNNYYIGLQDKVDTNSIGDKAAANYVIKPGPDYNKDTKTGKSVIIEATTAAETFFGTYDLTDEFKDVSTLGTYKDRMVTVEVRNVEDVNGKGMSTQAYTFKMEDKTATKVELGQKVVSEGDTTVKFKFSEPLKAASLAANAQLATGAEVYLNGDKIVAANVRITDSSGTFDEASEVIVTVPALKKGNNTFSFVGVKDLAGNFISPNPTVINVNAVKEAVTAEVPQVLEIYQVDDNAVVFVTNVEIDTNKGTIDVEKIDGEADVEIDLSSLNASEYKIDDVTGTVLADEPATSTKAAYKLTFLNATNDKDTGVLSYNKANTILRKMTINGLVNANAADKEMKTEYVKTVTLKKDLIAPTVLEVEHTADGFTIEFYDGPFDKDVVLPTGSEKDIVVKYEKDGATYSETVGYAATAADGKYTFAGNTITIQLTADKGLDSKGKLVAGATYTIELPDGVVNDGAKDDPGAELDPARPHDFVAKTLTYKIPGSSTDYSVPQVSQDDVTDPVASGNENTIELKLHGKNIDATTVTNAANYKWNGVALPKGTTIEFRANAADPDDNKIIIKLPQDTVEYAGNYKLEIKNIATKDGYKMLDTEVTVAAVDNYAPSIEKATITASNAILVKFSETMTQLTGSSLDQAVNNFVVTVDGAPCSVAEVIDSAEDKEVEIKTAADFNVDAKVIVKIDVDQNGNMVLKDKAGNKARTSSVTAAKQE